MYQNDCIMELVNKWLSAGKFRNFDTPFWTEFIYEMELVAALPLTGNSLCGSEMEYH